MTARALALVALAGCSWGQFDDLKDTTWVVSSTSPTSSADFGADIAWSATNGDGTDFLVSAPRNPPSLGAIHFSATGELSDDGGQIGEFGEDTPFTNLSMAGFDTVVGDGVVAVGTPDTENEDGKAVLYNISGEPTGAITLTRPGSPTRGTRIGDQLATGNTDAGDMGDPDVVGIGTDAVALWQDMAVTLGGTTTAHHCNVQGGDAIGVVLADVEATAGDEILIGVGDGSGPSFIIQLTGAAIDAADLNATNDQLCVEQGAQTSYIDAPGGEEDFGAMMIKGHFDNGTEDDIAVAAPESNKVYVFLNGSTDATDVPTPDAAETFGEAMTAGDFDGDGQDELVVGDGNATVEGATVAGRVHIFKLSGGAFSQVTVLHDVEPEDRQRFGRALTTAVFEGQDILVVGAFEEIFTYFQTSTGDDDPRP